MDRYVRVEQTRAEQSSITDNEVRTLRQPVFQGRGNSVDHLSPVGLHHGRGTSPQLHYLRHVLADGTRLPTSQALVTHLPCRGGARTMPHQHALNPSGRSWLLQEKGHDAVTLKGMGRAINKTVTIAEIIKRRIPHLHQLTEIGSVNITDTWEPLEEGLNTLETTRHVSVISITLSKVQLDSSKAGYQQPLPEDQVKPLQEGPSSRTRAPPAAGPSTEG